MIDADRFYKDAEAATSFNAYWEYLAFLNVLAEDSRFKNFMIKIVSTIGYPIVVTCSIRGRTFTDGGDKVSQNEDFGKKGKECDGVCPCLMSMDSGGSSLFFINN